MEEKVKSFAETVIKDECMRKLFIEQTKAIVIKVFEKLDEERRYNHYILFTPIWKQLLNKIRGKKPYKEKNYKPCI